MARPKPASSPPRVLVDISIPSLIQAIPPDSVNIDSPCPSWTSSICSTVPSILYCMSFLLCMPFDEQVPLYPIGCKQWSRLETIMCNFFEVFSYKWMSAQTKTHQWPVHFGLTKG